MITAEWEQAEDANFDLYKQEQLLRAEMEAADKYAASRCVSVSSPLTLAAPQP